MDRKQAMGGLSPQYYLNRYEDLRNAFGDDERAAAHHYFASGIHERRSPNPFFDPKSYFNRYGDLREAFGDDQNTGKQLVAHWLRNGIDEMRQGSDFFSLGFYYEHYDDLQAAFGRNAPQLFNHWVEYGNSEGRSTAPGKILRMKYRPVPVRHIEIVAVEGTEDSSDPDLFRPFKTTGGEIGFGIGLVIGVCAGDPVEGALAGALVGHGMDRVITRVVNDITGPAWEAVQHGPVGQVLGDAGREISNIFHHPHI